MVLLLLAQLGSPMVIENLKHMQEPKEVEGGGPSKSSGSLSALLSSQPEAKPMADFIVTSTVDNDAHLANLADADVYRATLNEAFKAAFIKDDEAGLYFESKCSLDATKIKDSISKGKDFEVDMDRDLDMQIEALYEYTYEHTEKGRVSESEFKQKYNTWVDDKITLDKSKESNGDVTKVTVTGESKELAKVMAKFKEWTEVPESPASEISVLIKLYFKPESDRGRTMEENKKKLKKQINTVYENVCDGVTHLVESEEGILENTIVTIGDFFFTLSAQLAKDGTWEDFKNEHPGSQVPEPEGTSKLVKAEYSGLDKIEKVRGVGKKKSTQRSQTWQIKFSVHVTEHHDTEISADLIEKAMKSITGKDGNNCGATKVMQECTSVNLCHWDGCYKDADCKNRPEGECNTDHGCKFENSACVEDQAADKCSSKDATTCPSTKYCESAGENCQDCSNNNCQEAQLALKGAEVTVKAMCKNSYFKNQNTCESIEHCAWAGGERCEDFTSCDGQPKDKCEPLQTKCEWNTSACVKKVSSNQDEDSKTKSATSVHKDPIVMFLLMGIYFYLQ